MGVDPKMDAALATLDKVAQRIAALDTIEQRLAAMEAFRAKLGEQLRAESFSMPGIETYRNPKTGEMYSLRNVALAVMRQKESGTPFEHTAPFEWGVSEEIRKGLRGSPETRVMSMLNDTGGGILVPVETSTKMVEYLHEKSSARQLGITVLQPTGVPFIVGKETSTVTAYMTGEAATAVAATDVGFGSVNLTPKKMTARTVITQELVKFGGARVEQIIQRHFAGAFAEKEDQQIFNGTGAEYQLRGITGTGGGINSANTAGTAQLLVGDIAGALQLLEEDRIPINSEIGIALHTRAKWNLKKQKLRYVSTSQTEAEGAGFTLGLPVMTDAILEQIIGYKIRSTTVHSTTLGGSSNETWPIIGRFSDYWLAEYGGLMVTASDIATDGTHNAYTEDKKHLKVTRWLDGGVVRDEAFALLKTLVYSTL